MSFGKFSYIFYKNPLSYLAKFQNFSKAFLWKTIFDQCAWFCCQFIVERVRSSQIFTLISFMQMSCLWEERGFWLVLPWNYRYLRPKMCSVNILNSMTLSKVCNLHIFNYAPCIDNVYKYLHVYLKNVNKQECYP